MTNPVAHSGELTDAWLYVVDAELTRNRRRLWCLMVERLRERQREVPPIDAWETVMEAAIDDLIHHERVGERGDDYVLSKIFP